MSASPFSLTVARVKLEAGEKPISSRSFVVAVRCYEARLGKLGLAQPSRCLAEFSQTLWTAAGPIENASSSKASGSAPNSPTYADLGDFEAAFRITLPTSAPGFSMATYPDYKVYWRVEAGQSTFFTLQMWCHC
jgi:hypothetical protein